ncbi:HlyD family efflux transporter periplasmic adaptor subunit [Herbaspirillum robiniae]|uniref:HlyD family efflux transporter periplasmic adaptor subunit n=1 Tax=Herbaspirillum robiniae TaxID=2014887 RepID=UPI003D789F07
MKKPVIAALIVVVLIVAGAYWWLTRQSEREAPLVLQGNVDIRQISLAFEGSGRIAELRGEEGDKVAAGTILAVLDTTSLGLQADQAQAQIEVQQQNLERLRNGSRPQERAQAKSRQVAAQAEKHLAVQELARLEDIATKTEGRGVSLQDLDRARSNLLVATSRVEDASQAASLTAQGPRKEDIAGAAAQLKASQAQLALLRHQIAEGELKAPSDAIIRSRLSEPGDMVTPQRPVFSLALMHPKWIRVYVSEVDLGKVKPGMGVAISTDSNPGQTIAGTIGYISSVAEFTPKAVQSEELRTSLVYEVRVIAEDKADQLRLGQPATVRLGDGTTQ